MFNKIFKTFFLDVSKRFSLGCFETFFSKQTNSVSTSIKQTTDCTKVITQVIYHSLSDKLRKVDRN